MRLISIKKPPWYKTRTFWLLLIGGPWFVWFAMISPLMGVREQGGLLLRCDKLHTLGLAFEKYYDAHGSFPPNAALGKDGKPLHSWRVLLLPYLGEETLYKSFRLNEPWDSPYNLILLPKMPECFRIPTEASEPGMTHYQVLVGPGTAFERPGLTKNDFPDGLSRTIFVVEAAVPVPWTKPADLAYDPKGQLPTFYRQDVTPSWFHAEGYKRFNVLFGDGDTRTIYQPYEPAWLHSLIDRNVTDKVKGQF